MKREGPSHGAELTDKEAQTEANRSDAAAAVALPGTEAEIEKNGETHLEHAEPDPEVAQGTSPAEAMKVWAQIATCAVNLYWSDDDWDGTSLFHNSNGRRGMFDLFITPTFALFRFSTEQRKIMESQITAAPLEINSSFAPCEPNIKSLDLKSYPFIKLWR